jgi:hypothetical protein
MNVGAYPSSFIPAAGEIFSLSAHLLCCCVSKIPLFSFYLLNKCFLASMIIITMAKNMHQKNSKE